MYVDISKVQDDVVGDGTTSVVVLAAELLRVSLINSHCCIQEPMSSEGKL